MQDAVYVRDDLHVETSPPRMTSIASPVALLVLGVSRSGTSALTRVLNLLGAGFPKDLLGAGPGNVRGHWEPSRLLDLNQEILAFHGSDWHDPRPFPQQWFESTEARIFVDRASALIDEQYGANRLIVIKEPRILRLAPLYIASLTQLGYAPHVVMPLRHPREVVDSLARRDGTDPRSSELIWIRHLLEAEGATRCCPRVWVSYDQLLKDWWSVQNRIGSELGIQWPMPPSTVAPAISAFLEPTLRHFDAGKDGSTETAGLVAARLWQAAQAGLAGNEPLLQAGFDSIRAVLDDIDHLSAPQVQSDKARICGLQSRLAERNEALQAMLNSKSWQITKPLRRLNSTIRHALVARPI